MVNALAHKIEITDRITVETAEQLSAAIDTLCDRHDYLDATYVVARLEETLSDGSVAISLSIRLAERA
jgi:Tfp pilus assembly protein PilF